MNEFYHDALDFVRGNRDSVVAMRMARDMELLQRLQDDYKELRENLENTLFALEEMKHDS